MLWFLEMVMASSPLGVSRDRGSPPASSSSAAHHSKQYDAGARGLLFSKKSPKLIRISPTSIILEMSFVCLAASSSVSILTTSPLVSLTVGPSMVLTGAAATAFPGSSTLTWVPAARKSPRMVMVAGLNPAAARPVFLDLPYLNLNPPGREG